ncbi:MAG TPA: ABC transporter substrate-binding protein [Acidimicrobiales bacterium]
MLHFGVDFASNFTANSFDPAKSLNGDDKIDQSLIYDTLTRLSPTGQLEPGLAQSWTFDTTTLTIHLRPGVQFSDGTAVDANAVKASVLHIKQSPLRTSLEVISGIDVVDPMTLTFHLTSPTAPDLLYAWNDLDGMVIAPSGLKTADTHPVGSGPYIFESFTPGARLVLKRNPNYWDKGKFLVPEIDFIQVGVGPPAISALEAGSIDMTTFQPESYSAVKANPALAASVRSSHEYAGIQFRLSTPPLNNPLVRQAVNYAIDRDEINRVVFDGLGVITDETFAPDQPDAFNQAESHHYIPYDPAKARQLLTQAGFPNGVTFTMVIPANVTLFQREAPLLQNQMAKAGITAKIVTVDAGDLLVTYYEHKQDNALAAENPAEEEPARQLYDSYGKSGFGAVITGSVRPELENLLVQGMGTLDPAALKPLMQQASQLATDEALEAPIVFVPQMLAWRKARIGGTPMAGSDASRPDFMGFFVKK